MSRKFKALSIAICMAGVWNVDAKAADETSVLRARLSVVADTSYQTLAREFEIVEAVTGDTGRTTFQPEIGKSYFVYGLCDENCTNIDLELTDSHDTWWSESDHRPDAAPIVMIPSSDSLREITIALDMVACQTASCTMGIGIYRVDI